MKRQPSGGIGIIGAMKAETEPMVEEMAVHNLYTIGNMHFYSGTLWDKSVTVCTAGVGKVNAALCTQILIHRFNPACVINTGVAGGMIAGLLPGSVIIGDRFCQHDFDTSAVGDEVGFVSGPDRIFFDADAELLQVARQACDAVFGVPVRQGTVASGDQFVSDPEVFRQIHARFGAIACEMEGCAIAQAALLNRVPFVAIRSISDNYNEAHMEYSDFLPMAVSNSNRVCREMLARL